MVYSLQADTEAIFGANNVSKWADLNNNENTTEIAARITAMILEAYNQINARLENCAYTVPFTLVSSAYDPVIVTLSARLTGVLLYDCRKLVDAEDFDEVQNHRRMVEEVYVKIHGGQLKLVTYTANAVSYPQAIDSTVDAL